MNKKINILMALACVGVLASCGPDETSDTSTPNEDASVSKDVGDWTVPSSVTGDYKVTVWCAEAVTGLTSAQCNAWAEEYYAGGSIEFTVTAVGEGDAANNVVQDIESAADLFFFAQDQTARLVSSGGLTQLVSDSKYHTFVTENNTASAVSAATFGEAVYAYPVTADNGYFVYYDTSVISETQIATWDGIIEACKEANKTFYYDYGNIWYSIGMFFGTGCVEEWETDDAGNFISVTSSINDPILGVAAARQLWDMGQSGVMNAGSDASTGFGASAAAVVSGTWDAANAKSLLGDNYGVAVLPSFTQGGVTYHTGGYTGSKLIGVKPHSDTGLQVICQNLAGYLSDTDCSLDRFNQQGWGPSNIVAAADEAVLADEALTALLTESSFTAPNGNLVIRQQGQIPGDWWTPANSLTTSIVNAQNDNDETLQAILNEYVSGLDAYLTTDD